MKGHNIDWRYMQRATIIVGCCVALSAAMIGGVQSYRHIVDQQHSQQQSNFYEQQQRYNTAVEDHRLLGSFRHDYQRLKRQGLVGEEHRLYWVETLRNIAESLHLKKVSYRIEPQQAFSAEYLQDLGDISVQVSRMVVQMDLLHEGDLLYLIDGLNAKAPGSFHINNCNLKRNQETFILHPSNTNMLAECEVNWFTLKAPTQEGDIAS